MILKAIGISVVILLAFPLIIPTSEVDGQIENMVGESALIVYSCQNGFNVNNICVLRDNSTETEQITNAIYSNRELLAPKINSHGQIVHLCELENDRNDICLINPDGSGLQRVSLTSPYDKNFAPDINDEGTIVFSCRSEDNQQSICILDAGSTDARELELNVGIKDFPRIQIDNAGRILFSCLSSIIKEDLCMVNSDGSGLTYLNKIQDQSETNVDFYMNNNGQAVFFCRSQLLGEGICLADLKSFEVQLIIKNSQIRRVSNPFINDTEQIVFSCSFQRSTDICVMTLHNGEIRRLTEAMPNEFNIASAITPNGVIAFRCTINGNDNLCTINFDGTNLQQLTFLNENEENSEPVINNHGQIVFRCENADGDLEACFINNIDSPVVNLSEEYQIGRVFELDINDRGEIAFSCKIQGRGNDLCVIDLEQETLNILTNNPDTQGDGTYNININNMGIIAYQCASKFRSNVCYSISDGSSEGVLIKDNGARENFFPTSINDHNQIALSCSFERLVNNICIVDLESNLSQITEDATRLGVGYSRPKINNVGRLSFSCSDHNEEGLLLHICSINLDGSVFFNHAINSTETLAGHEPAINDQNVIVYACHSTETSAFDLCVIRPELNGTFVEDRVLGEFRYLEPSINNRNEIVYQCRDIQGNRNICYHNLETDETKQLTFLNSSGRVFYITSQ